MVAVSNWMHVDFFTLDQAAALWCDFDPTQINAYSSSNPPEVAAAKQLLIGGLTGGDITPNTKLGTHSHILNYSDVLVSRSELEKFARMKKLFPAFLFNTLAPFEKAESELDKFNRFVAAKMVQITKPEPPVNQGGRPPEYDWDSFMLEIIRRANMPDGLPDSQAELVRDMLQWFSDTSGSEPAESSLKARTSKIYNYLDKEKDKVKNPGV
jgi:hypothetical protein